MEQARPTTSTRAPLGARNLNTHHERLTQDGSNTKNHRASSPSSSLLMAKVNAIRARENVKSRMLQQVDYPTPPPSSQSPARSQTSSRYSASASPSPLTPASKAKDSYKRDREITSPVIAARTQLKDDSPNPRMKKRTDERPTPNRRPATAQPRYSADSDADDDDEAQNAGNSPRRSKASSGGSRVLDLMSIRSDPIPSETTAANISASFDSSIRRSGRARTQAPGKGIAAALAPAPSRAGDRASPGASFSTGRQRSATPRQANSASPAFVSSPAPPAAIESEAETSDPNELFSSSDEDENEAQYHSQPILKPVAKRISGSRGRVSNSQPLPSSSGKSSSGGRRSVPPPQRRRAKSAQLGTAKTPANGGKTPHGSKKKAATTVKRPPPIGPREKLSPFVPRPASPSDDPLLLKGRDGYGRRAEEQEQDYEDGEVNDTFAAVGRQGRRAAPADKEQSSSSATSERVSLLDPALSEHEYSCGQADSSEDEDEGADDDGAAMEQEPQGAHSFSSDFSRLAAEMRADLGTEENAAAEEMEQEEPEEYSVEMHDAGHDGLDFAFGADNHHDDGGFYMDAAAGADSDSDDGGYSALQEQEQAQAQHVSGSMQNLETSEDQKVDFMESRVSEDVSDATWPDEQDDTRVTEPAANYRDEEAHIAAIQGSPSRSAEADIRQDEDLAPEQPVSEDEAVQSVDEEVGSDLHEPAPLAPSSAIRAVVDDERDAAEAEETLNGFANMSVTQDEGEDEEEHDVKAAESLFKQVTGAPIESTPARAPTAATAQPSLFSQSVILPSPSTTGMAQRSHSHLESDSMRSMMHSLHRPTPIVEVMSSDAQAAARAAAILRLHHNWIHEGTLTTTAGHDGAEKTFVGSVLTGGHDDTTAPGDNELPQLLKDAEAELARLGVAERNQARSKTPDAVADTTPEANYPAATAATPLANQTLSAPTPRVPGAWSWSPLNLSFLAPSLSTASSRAPSREPTPLNGNALSQALQADSTSFPRSAWKALEGTVKGMVREAVGEAQGGDKDKAQRAAWRTLSLSTAVDRFIAAHDIDASQLRDRWSRRSLERSVLALQRQYFCKLERRNFGCLTEEEALLAERPLGSESTTIGQITAPVDMTSSHLQTPMASLSRAVLSGAEPSPLMRAATASHSTPLDPRSGSNIAASRANSAARAVPLDPPTPLATPSQPFPSPAPAEAHDVAATPVQQQRESSTEGSFMQRSWSLKKRVSQLFRRGEEAEKEQEQDPPQKQAQEQEGQPAEESTEVVVESEASSSPSEEEVVTADVEEALPSPHFSPRSIYPAVPTSPMLSSAMPPPPPPEPTAADLSSASARELSASSVSARPRGRSSISSTTSSSADDSNSSLLAQEAAAAAAVMLQKRQLNRVSRTTGLVTESPKTKGGNNSFIISNSTSTWISPRVLRKARASQAGGEGARSPLAKRTIVTAAVDRYNTSRASTSLLSPPRARSSLSLAHRSSSFVRPTAVLSANSPAKRASAPVSFPSRNLGTSGGGSRGGSSFVRPTVLAGLGDDSHVSARLKAQALAKAREDRTWLSPLAKRRRAEQLEAQAAGRKQSAKGVDPIAAAVAAKAAERRARGSCASPSFLSRRRAQEEQKENSFDQSAEEGSSSLQFRLPSTSGSATSGRLFAPRRDASSGSIVARQL
ncbi:hypothetical protein BDZ90DRAFT_231791 [Jaminaea rosea]|uniref:Uncharacterized protein n=1 Tax=Jaminaea rosea TaxID=1569628 RepID=A0A316USQ3_9BASI|nr:hypothetical protein BDZ90DRAFT_231791 [Jaminaea rosea]PWN28024.1 hypothetical protein BDZ90DRAFT_231791 [Jaminaea rosea]